MGKFSKAILATLSLTITLGGLVAFADDEEVFEEEESCVELLEGTGYTIPSLTLEIAEMETLYLEFIQNAVAVVNLPLEKQEPLAEDLIKKKAQILNQLFSILFQLRKKGVKSDLRLSEVYKILISLGVPPNMYGLKVVFDTVVFSQDVSEAEFKSSEPGNKTVSVEVGKAKPVRQPIGFHQVSGSSNQEQQPAGFHQVVEPKVEKMPIGFGHREKLEESTVRRTIGFHSIAEKEAEPLLPKVGRIHIDVSDDGTLNVLDMYGGSEVHAPLGLIQRLETFKSPDREFSLDFDSKKFVWILRYQNLANPTGTIGFTLPKPSANSLNLPQSLQLLAPVFNR